MAVPGHEAGLNRLKMDSHPCRLRSSIVVTKSESATFFHLEWAIWHARTTLCAFSMSATFIYNSYRTAPAKHVAVFIFEFLSHEPGTGTACINVY